MTEALKSVKLDRWPETAHVGKYVIRTPNGVMSGNAYSKPGMEDTQPYIRADHVDALEAQASAEGFDRGVQEAQPIVESLRAELHALYAAIGFDPTDLENGHDNARQALDALLKAERERALREAAEEARDYGHGSYAAMMISDAILAIIEKDATDG